MRRASLVSLGMVTSVNGSLGGFMGASSGKSVAGSRPRGDSPPWRVVGGFMVARPGLSGHIAAFQVSSCHFRPAPAAWPCRNAPRESERLQGGLLLLHDLEELVQLGDLED